MFEQRTLRSGSDRNGKALSLLFLQRFAVEERNHLIEDRDVACGANVMRGDEGKPEKIVTDPSTDARARLWMPPVLDIAFHELSRGRAQDKASLQPNATVVSLLQGSAGKSVWLHLRSGEKMGGKISQVTDNIVHLSNLSGAEFFDAFVDVKDISAVVVRVADK
jgi:hypothetical protein